MRRNCQTDPNRARAQAEATAAAIIAQGHAVAGIAEPEPEEEPMNRYIHPIHTSCPSTTPACCCTGADQATLDHILETLCCQNQLLLDLLAAVNSLTVAMLNSRRE